MHYRHFITFNVLWAPPSGPFGITWLGYSGFLSSGIRENIDTMILVIVFISVVPDTPPPSLKIVKSRRQKS